MSYVFLSYAHTDEQDAGQLRSYLQHRGIEVWRYQRARPGSENEAKYEDAILNADAIVILWTENSIQSPYVCHEASYAKLNRSAVFTTLNQDLELPEVFREDLPIPLDTMWKHEEKDPGIDDLIRALRKIMKKKRFRRILLNLAVMVMLLISLGTLWKSFNLDAEVTEISDHISALEVSSIDTLDIVIRYVDFKAGDRIPRNDDANVVLPIKNSPHFQQKRAMVWSKTGGDQEYVAPGRVVAAWIVNSEAQNIPLRAWPQETDSKKIWVYGLGNSVDDPTYATLYVAYSVDSN